MSDVNNRPLFPLDHGVIAEAIDKFSHFSDAELQLLNAANLALLPEGNASRFVLEFNLRPDLQEGDDALSELRRRAYRTGVLLGRRAVKRSIEFEGETEYVILKQEQVDEVLRRTTRGKEFIPPQERGLQGWLDRRFAQIDPAYGFYPYLQIEDEILQGVLRQAWLAAGLEYYTEDAIRHNIDDEIPRGMKDLFRVFALLDVDTDKKWRVKQPEVSSEATELATETQAAHDSKSGGTIYQLLRTENLIAALEAIEKRSPELQDYLLHLYDVRANLQKTDKLERRSVLLGKITVPAAAGLPLIGATASAFVNAGPIVGLVLAGVAGAGSYAVVRAIPHLENIARRTLRDM